MIQSLCDLFKDFFEKENIPPELIRQNAEHPPEWTPHKSPDFDLHLMKTKYRPRFK